MQYSSIKEMLIAAFGQLKVAASLVDIKYPTLTEMSRRNSIPAEYWLDFQQAEETHIRRRHKKLPMSHPRIMTFENLALFHSRAAKTARAAGATFPAKGEAAE